MPPAVSRQTPTREDLSPLGQIGDITFFQDRVVTPSGTAPIAGLTWTMRDQSSTTEKISTAGIVLAVCFFWVCFLGLLFLLMKEKSTHGYVDVTVQGNGFFHMTQLPISDPSQVTAARGWVDYARSISATA